MAANLSRNPRMMDKSHIRMAVRVGTTGLLLLLVSQILFWSMVSSAEHAARPPDMEMREEISYVLYNKAGEQVSENWGLKAERDGFRGYYAPGDAKAHSAVFSILFTVEDNRNALAFYLENREYIEEITLNGLPLQPDKPLRRLQGEVSAEAALYDLPSRYLQNGTNVIYVKTLSLAPQIYLAPFAIGSAPQLEAAYRIRSLLEVDVPIAGVAVLLFTIALCLVVNWPPEDRARMHWLIAFLSLNAGSTVALTLVPSTDSIRIMASIIVLTNLLLGLSVSRYAALDTGNRGLWPYWIFGGCLVLIFAAAIALPMLLPNYPLAIYRFSILGSHSVAMLMTAAALWLLLCRTAVTGGERWFERLVLIFCMTTFIVDRLAYFTDVHPPFGGEWPLSLYWSPIVGPFLGIGMLLSLARQAGEARREVTQSNMILAARLKEQDAALSRSYDAQKQMLGRQVMLEERQRIVRDMHDGIGGQLLGLMMQVRQGGVDKVEVEQGLQSSIADLRLIVDSMDSAEDGLAETLRSFEHRVRAQVEAAGIAMKFQHDIDEGIDLGPRPTLQVLRILQEAVTNAMRHSGASQIAVTGVARVSGNIEISVRDNGTGMPENLRRGRGLTSMETRARNLGGDLRIQTSGTGTLLCFTLPLAEAGAT